MCILPSCQQTCSQLGEATGQWLLYCQGTMTEGLLLFWWASTVPSAVLHNSLTVSQGSRAWVDVKSDSPPVSLNMPPSAHLFIHFIFLFGPLIWTLGSPSKLCHISEPDRTWLGSEVTLLVLVSACLGMKCTLPATQLSCGYRGLFWELHKFQITLRIYVIKMRCFAQKYLSFRLVKWFTRLCNRKSTVYSL